MNLLMAITEEGAVRNGDGDSVGCCRPEAEEKEVMSLIGKEGLSSCDEGDYDRFSSTASASAASEMAQQQ